MHEKVKFLSQKSIRKQLVFSIMPFGSNADLRSLVFEKIDSASIFFSFNCGVQEIDDFIHTGLRDYMSMAECETYCVRCDDNVVAMFCLGKHSLFLDDAVKEKMDSGVKPTPKHENDSYWEWMNSFPSVEITYLAVDVNYQRKGIGSFIIEELVRFVASREDSRSDFLTVRAYNRKDYSAIPFYSKCGFTNATSEVEGENLFMYRVLPRD